MDPVLYQIRQEPDDLADENTSRHLVDHLAPIFPKQRSIPATNRLKAGDTFIIEQE